MSLDDFVDYVALLYHEARNVRHLIRAGYLADPTFARLISLPRNRSNAWSALQGSRREARKASSASGAEAIFHRRFGLTLEDLAVLFENPHWKDSDTGGNQWARVAAKVIELREALCRNDAASVSDLASDVAHMDHNTGSVGGKLRELDRAL